MTAAVDEHAARAITAVRAIETTDRERALLSDAERAAVSQEAAVAVGASAPPERFLAKRAALALERIATRHAVLARVANAFAWRGWITPAVLGIAFVAGVAADHIGAGGRINILAPPVLGLLAWNLAVYLVLIERWSAGWRQRARKGPGPVRRALTALAVRTPRMLRPTRQPPLASAIAAFTAAWTERAAPLYAVRAARILHLAAAVFAAGVLAGMYVRGLAFEYRASWESTFLGPETVHALLAFALAPGAWLTGIGVPDVAHIASIRTGADPGSENAAPWLHLYAATVLVVVIAPRLVLAALDAWLERRRARFALPLAEPYFRRLLLGFSEGPYRVRVVPYSYSPPSPGTDATLHTMIARAFGALCEASAAPTVPYGGEDALSDAIVPPETSLVVALFNAAATPEPASHGAFVAALTARGCDVVALVDESTLRARWPGDEARLEQRRIAWRDVLTSRNVGVAFVQLAAPDLAAAEADLQQAAQRTVV
jgi:hypothetical protein